MPARARVFMFTFCVGWLLVPQLGFRGECVFGPEVRIAACRGLRDACSPTGSIQSALLVTRLQCVVLLSKVDYFCSSSSVLLYKLLCKLLEHNDVV